MNIELREFLKFFGIISGSIKAALLNINLMAYKTAILALTLYE
jgi:hypothetical protein